MAWRRQVESVKLAGAFEKPELRSAVAVAPLAVTEAQFSRNSLPPPARASGERSRASGHVEAAVGFGQIGVGSVTGRKRERERQGR